MKTEKIIGILATVGFACQMTSKAKSERHEELINAYRETTETPTQEGFLVWLSDKVKAGNFWPVNDRGEYQGINKARTANTVIAGFWNARSYVKRWYNADMVKVEKDDGEGSGGEGSGGEGSGGEGSGVIPALTVDVALDFLVSSLPVDVKTATKGMKAITVLREIFGIAC